MFKYDRGMKMLSNNVWDERDNIGFNLARDIITVVYFSYECIKKLEVI